MAPGRWSVVRAVPPLEVDATAGLEAAVATRSDPDADRAVRHRRQFVLAAKRSQPVYVLGSGYAVETRRHKRAAGNGEIAWA